MLRLLAFTMICLGSVYSGAIAGIFPPSNDNYANAVEIRAETGLVYGDTTLATIESGETQLGNDADQVYNKTVWYKYKALVTGPATLLVKGNGTSSLMDYAEYVAIDVFKDASPSAANRIARAFPETVGGGYFLRLTFDARAGNTYRIRVGSWDAISSTSFLFALMQQSGSGGPMVAELPNSISNVMPWLIFGTKSDEFLASISPKTWVSVNTGNVAVPAAGWTDVPNGKVVFSDSLVAPRRWNKPGISLAFLTLEKSSLGYPYFNQVGTWQHKAVIRVGSGTGAIRLISGVSFHRYRTDRAALQISTGKTNLISNRVDFVELPVTIKNVSAFAAHDCRIVGLNRGFAWWDFPSASIRWRVNAPNYAYGQTFYLAAGASRDITVKLRPNYAGTYSGVIHAMCSDAPPQPSPFANPVSLTGTP